jgi:hypothetical protein
MSWLPGDRMQSTEHGAGDFLRYMPTPSDVPGSSNALVKFDNDAGDCDYVGGRRVPITTLAEAAA